MVVGYPSIDVMRDMRAADPMMHEVEDDAVRLVDEHLATPESGLALPASLVRRTFEARRARRAEDSTPRTRARDCRDDEGDGDEADGGDGLGDDGEGRRRRSEAAGPRQFRERDLLRRLVRRLSGMRSVGNQQAMASAKMLERLVSYFGREPRASRKCRSRLDIGPSVGAEEVWLDAHARARLARPPRRRQRGRYRVATGTFEMPEAHARSRTRGARASWHLPSPAGCPHCAYR